ncbi:MAG: family 43 glycosylhydrolase [Pseudomonadota bacterium]
MAQTPLRDPVPDTGDEALDLHIHDPSRIVQMGDVEVIAVTGKEQSARYECGLELWERPTGASGPWRMFECLLRDKPDWVAARVPSNDGAYWAPDFVDEGRILYSVASSFEDGGVSCLGLVERDAVGIWRDLGAPLSCTAPRAPGSPEISVIDPAFFETLDGRAFVVTGGGVLHVAQVDPGARDLGMPDVLPGPGWTELARGPVEGTGEHLWVEAPHMHEHDGAFYLFVNWGACCQGVASTYEIRVGRSNSPFGPFLDPDGRDMMAGHGALLLEGEGALRGPGHASVRQTPQGDVLSFHFYDARRGGLPWIGETALTWLNGWPKVMPWPDE